MKALLLFIGVTVLGWGAGVFTRLNPVEAPFFHAFTSAALVLGLYGSVVGIDLEAVRPRKWLAVIIITVAVPLQILATGAVMWLAYPAGVSFLLAVAIDQIDPLSTATLLQDKDKMSASAKGLLRIWASFDDPVTVLFGFLILLPLVTGQTTAGNAWPAYFGGLGLNLIPAAALWLLTARTKIFQTRALALAALGGALLYAFFTESYLFAAIAGLLLRPLPERYLQAVITALYQSIVFIVGMTLFSYGVDWRLGLMLAIVEYFVIQPLTALILINGSFSDMFRIAYAQQNGLTTLLMGLAFESAGVRVLPILLPAIIAINTFNLAVNKLYTWKEARGLLH